MRHLSRLRPAGVLALASLVMVPLAGASAEPTVHTVRIQGFAFVPVRLEVSAGDAVVWINEDIAPHTATGAGASWDAGSLAQGETRTVTFAALGTFAYVCRFHRDMRGEVVVVPGPVDRPASGPSAESAR